MSSFVDSVNENIKSQKQMGLNDKLCVLASVKTKNKRKINGGMKKLIILMVRKNI